MDLEDFGKPAGAVLGAAALLAAGFAAGFVVARDPAVVRRLARAVAGGAERLSLALAETREELADLWAGAREDARVAAEAAAFTAGETTVAGAAAAGAAAMATSAPAANPATGAPAEASSAAAPPIPAVRRRTRAPRAA
jgi:hypothetical protein